MKRRELTKLVTIAGVLVVVLALLISGCAKAAPALGSASAFNYPFSHLIV